MDQVDEWISYVVMWIVVIVVIFLALWFLSMHTEKNDENLCKEYQNTGKQLRLTNLQNPDLQMVIYSKPHEIQKNHVTLFNSATTKEMDFCQVNGVYHRNYYPMIYQNDYLGFDHEGNYTMWIVN